MRPLDGPQASVNNSLKRGTMDTEREREKPGICVQREKITETDRRWTAANKERPQKEPSLPTLWF